MYTYKKAICKTRKGLIYQSLIYKVRQSKSRMQWSCYGQSRIQNPVKHL